MPTTVFYSPTHTPNTYPLTWLIGSFIYCFTILVQLSGATILYNSSVNVYYHKISNHCNPTTNFHLTHLLFLTDLKGSGSWGFCFTISKVCSLNYQSRPKSLSSKLDNTSKKKLNLCTVYSSKAETLILLP